MRKSECAAWRLFFQQIAVGIVMTGLVGGAGVAFWVAISQAIWGPVFVGMLQLFFAAMVMFAWFDLEIGAES